MRSTNKLLISGLMVVSLSLALPDANGQGQFSGPHNYPAGISPAAIVAGDFNGDGKKDLAVADYGDSTTGAGAGVTILLGKGDGTFQPGVHCSVGPILGAIAAADFNQDGKLDLVVTTGVGPNSLVAGITILLGNGDGTLRVTTSIALDGPRSLAVGDFNGDGKLDVAAGIDDSPTTTAHLSILLGRGDGSFSPPANYAMPGALIPWSVAVSDFNGDNYLDVAVSTFALSSIGIFLGKGDGTFQPQLSTSFPNGSSGDSVAVGDFNRDGKPDLFATNQKFCVNVIPPCHPFVGGRVLLGMGDGTFQAQDLLTGSSGYNHTDSTAIADYNSDGNLDLAFTSNDGVTSSVSVMFGNGDGTFQSPVAFTIASAPRFLVAADFNGDNRPDLALPNPGGNSVSILLNTTRSASFLLSVTATGTGIGTVTSNPTGINCGSLCSENLAAGNTVTLTANAAPGSSFAGWTGAGCTGTGTCRVTMNDSESVTATFVSGARLTVSVTGSGSGSVASNLGVISCGSVAGPCSALFAPGTAVSLTATPSGNSTFAGWSGACNGIDPNTCKFILNSDQPVVATFNSPFNLQGITLNGSALLSSTRLRLTTASKNLAGSGWSTAPVNVQSFTNDFTFQLTNTTTSAIGNGIAFVIQNTGVTALGPSGGGLGYGPDNISNPSGSSNKPIAKSVAIKFDLVNNAGEGSNSTGIYTNGASPTIPAVTVGNGVNLHNGHIFKVHMSYDGTKLTLTVTDTVNTAQAFTTSWNINIPGTVGGNAAYVGFTGGTGTSVANQDIVTWTFNSAQSAAKTPIVYRSVILPAVSSGPTFRTFSYSGFPDTTGTILDATGAGNNVTFTVNVPAAGTYDIKLSYKQNTNRGISQFAINGTNVGGPLDQYLATEGYAAVDYGSFTFPAAGNYSFRFTILGKNARATSYPVSFDDFTLTPQ
jgi:hypothetical protein